MFDTLTSGFSLFATPLVIVLTFVGAFLGLVIGVLPGLGPLMGIILLLPLVINFPTVAGMGMLIAVFVGGSCGGALTAITLRIPGTPIAAATLLDGYPMAQKGRTGDAIGLAIAASSIGGLFGGIILIFGAPLLAEFALKFTPPEYFALTLLGLTSIAVVGSDAPVKGFMTGCLGLLVATVGTDTFANAQRFTLGSYQLTNGFHIVPIIVGLFAMSELVVQIEAGMLLAKPNIARFKVSLRAFRLLMRHPFNLLRSSAIGTFFGALPGAGGVISAFAAYAVAKANSRPDEHYGQGEEGGVVATESANNASVGATLVPTMALGIPGDASSGVLMAALVILGYFPGPLLFEQNMDVAGGMFLAYITANIALAIIGFVMTPLIIRVLRLRKVFLLPTVLLLSVMGTFSLQSSVFDLWVMLGFGLIGYMLRRYRFPLAPIVIGVVLGPICEANFRRSMLISTTGALIFFERPISAVILIAIILLLIWTFVGKKIVRRRRHGGRLFNRKT
jgi:putative tricarboxylic transport membrane protein